MEWNHLATRKAGSGLFPRPCGLGAGLGGGWAGGRAGKRCEGRAFGAPSRLTHRLHLL